MRKYKKVIEVLETIDEKIDFCQKCFTSKNEIRKVTLMIDILIKMHNFGREF